MHQTLELTMHRAMLKVVANEEKKGIHANFTRCLAKEMVFCSFACYFENDEKLFPGRFQVMLLQCYI